MNNPPKGQTNRGCAILLNLFASGILLLLLLWFLLPGLVKMPNWAKLLKNVALTETRQVWGPAIHITEDTRRENPSHLLIINTQVENSTVNEILKRSKRDSVYNSPIVLSLKKSDTYELVWEKKLDNLKLKSLPSVKITSDQAKIYLTDENSIRAINLYSGEILWTNRLSSQIHPSCKNCLQVLEDNFVFVLTQDKNLYGINSKNGRVLWKYTLKDALTSRKGFYVLANQIGFVDKVDSKPESPVVFYLINAMNGKTRDKIILGNTFLANSIFINDDKLFFFKALKNGHYSLQTYLWKSKQLLRELKLPDDFQNNLDNRTNEIEGLLIDKNNLILNYSSKSSHLLLKINLLNNTISTLLEDKSYKPHILEVVEDFLIVKAQKTTDLKRDEIWLLEKKSGEIKWKYTIKALQPHENFLKEFTWSAKVYNQALLLLQIMDNSENLSLESFNIYTGELLKKDTYKVKSSICTGIHWLSDSHKVYLTCGNLYNLDLRSRKISIEWP